MTKQRTTTAIVLGIATVVALGATFFPEDSAAPRPITHVPVHEPSGAQILSVR